MAKYRMENDNGGVSVVDTDRAINSWNEDYFIGGNGNKISTATGSQWDHERLYESRKGQFYLVCSSDWQGRSDAARWISDTEAVQWLAVNGHDTPERLQALAEECIE